MSPRRYRAIGYAGVFVFVFGILLDLAIVPRVVKHTLKKKIALKNGWPMREIWSKLPFTIESHMYIFNVTNPVEIDAGAKPVVREIGPFVYDVYQEKVEQLDDEEEDTVSYVLNNVYHFNPHKSRGLSDELEVYFPHTYIMTASTGILKDKGPLASFASRSVDSVLNHPSSLFYKVKARVPLFDGFPIVCAGIEDYFGKLTCNLLRERYYDFTLRKRANNDTFYTSVFGFLNGTYDKQNRVRIRRGTSNIQDVGNVVELSGMKNLSTWKDDRCDAFDGTDGTIFPPLANVKRKDDMVVVNQFLCRKLKLSYESEVEFAGLKLFRYTVDLGTDGDRVPEEKCYCIAEDRCLKKGMFELYRCNNIPVVLSNPHFYLADPYYLARVDNLKPDKDKHLTYVDFDPLTGSPVRAHTRAQLNMELLKIDKFRLMRNYSYAMLPMVWTDEIIVLPDFLVDDIKLAHTSVKLIKILEGTLTVSGLTLCALAGYLKYKSSTPNEVDLKSADATSRVDFSEPRSAVALPSSVD